MSGNLSYNGIHYRLYGESGPWVVFIHGFCENMELWNKVIPDTTSKRILVLDLPGFGLSSDLDFSNLQELGKPVIALFNYLNIQDPILFGHSMGGYLAVEMIKTQMITVKALGMVHSTFQADSEEKKSNRDKTIQFLEEQPLNSFLSLFTEGLFALHNAHDQSLRETAGNMVSQNRTRMVQLALKAMKIRQESTHWLQNTDLPVMILAGRHDRHVPLQVSLTEIAMCKRGMFHILENSGHIGQIEEPEYMKAILSSFIAWVDDLQA